MLVVIPRELTPQRCGDDGKCEEDKKSIHTILQMSKWQDNLRKEKHPNITKPNSFPKELEFGFVL